MFELAIFKKNDIIETGENLDKQKEILIQLGKEALIENGDWVIIYRYSPLEFPMKG